jgi:hypothetical protein
MKVKCTYENCFKHFSSTDAMIAHKKKDPNHSYCERCDVDCEDDMLYFIHQLGSSAHSKLSPIVFRHPLTNLYTAVQYAAPSTKV